MRLFFFTFLLVSVQLTTAQDTISVNIDFGSNLSPAPWNNLTLPRTGSLSQLSDDRGFPTSISIEVDDSFNGINNSGATDPAVDLPATASSDSFFGNRDSFSNRIELTGGLLLSGLDTSLRYDLSLFASRLASNNRETQYNVSSASQDTLFLQVADNTANWASLSQLQARPDGTIHIEATTGPNNNSTYGFFYLGALQLQYIDSIIPRQRTLSLVNPNGDEYWQPGQTPEIRWQGQGNPIVRIDYSSNDGNTWNFIDSVPGVQKGYAWTVPNTPSEKCLIRLSSDTITVQSNRNFTIASEDTASCHIVVLGSSTAAGTGPSMRDSAWVWKYRDYLFQRDTRFQVTNLARGGFTTYNILPSETSIPGTVNQSIDTARNVTKALSLEPDGIIINLPSNDAANDYPVEDQLRNYDDILSPLLADSIPFWICTPQPRNFSTNKIQIQLELLDSTFARFGPFTIDFWNGIADSSNRVDPSYDSGDGIHLNNPGHQLLFERVIGAQIDTFLLTEKTSSVISTVKNLADNPLFLRLFPNPAADQFTLSYQLPETDHIRLRIVDVSGNIFREINLHKQQTGKHELQLDTGDLKAGIYYCYLEMEELEQKGVIRFLVSKN